MYNKPTGCSKPVYGAPQKQTNKKEFNKLIICVDTTKRVEIKPTDVMDIHCAYFKVMFCVRCEAVYVW
jgi:hypothetical protein